MINPYLVSEPVSESSELTEARREIAELRRDFDDAREDAKELRTERTINAQGWSSLCDKYSAAVAELGAALAARDAALTERDEARRLIARLADRLDHSVSFEWWAAALADLDLHMKQSEERLRLVAEGARHKEVLLAEHRRMREQLVYIMEEAHEGPLLRQLDKLTDEIPER